MGCSPFARRYSGNRFFFLLLQLLRCFSSLGLIEDPGIKARLSTPPGLSQTSTPILLMPRHPPCALTSLTTSIQGSNKLPFRSLRVGYPWCLAQRYPSRYSTGITELYPSNARKLSPTRPQGTGWKLKMPSTTTKLSKNFSPKSAKSRILYAGDFDVNRGYIKDPRKRRQPTRRSDAFYA